MSEMFRRRILWMELLFILVGTGAVILHFYWAGSAREELLEAGKKIALHTGYLHPARGRIFDANGRLLAWTERYYDLHRNPRRSSPAEITALVEAICPGAGTHPVIRSLTPRQIGELSIPLNRTAAWEIRERRERITVDADLTGLTESRGVLIVGVSGAELQYDERLNGTPGEFQVMRGPHQAWIEKTFRLIRETTPGEDVFLQDLPEQPEEEP